jgi:hypothetical protein
MKLKAQSSKLKRSSKIQVQIGNVLLLANSSEIGALKLELLLNFEL